MEMYFIKSAACLAVLLLFYKLLLERENMHVFKRFYLLTSVVAAIVIPMITFTTYIEPSSASSEPVFLTSSEEMSSNSISFSEYLPFIFWSVYIIGVLFFSIKFIRNLKDLVDRIRKNPQIKRNRFTNVLLSEKISPHTFFSYIFLNKSKYERQEIPREVLVHEEAHALQKHSMDILLVELFQIIFWLNPFIFLQKKAIKLNHEFLADRAVIRKGFSTSDYQQTLLSFSSGELQSDLVNPINYSSIKKRFTVMKTQTSKTAILGKALLLIPLFAGLVYSCSSEAIVETDPTAAISVQKESTLELDVHQDGSIFLNNKKISISELQDIDKGKYTSMSINASTEAPQPIIDELVEVIRSKGVRTISICSPGNRDFMNSVPHSNDKEKATPKIIAEYNELAKMYLAKGVTTANVEDEEFKRLFYIYGIMTPGQRETSEKLPPPPPPPAAPAPELEMNAENVPPPPPPLSVYDLAADGAVFYYKGKTIVVEEARSLVEVQKSAYIELPIRGDEKPRVKITDKKDKN